MGTPTYLLNMDYDHLYIQECQALGVETGVTEIRRIHKYENHLSGMPS